jgi:hypothetical protein
MLLLAAALPPAAGQAHTAVAHAPATFHDHAMAAPGPPNRDAATWLQHAVHHLYMHLPGWSTVLGRVGGWEGLDPADVCASLQPGTSALAWAAQPARCDAIITRRVVGLTLLVYLFLLVMVAWSTFRLVLTCLTSRSAWMCVLRTCFGCAHGVRRGSRGCTLRTKQPPRDSGNNCNTNHQLAQEAHHDPPAAHEWNKRL